MDFEKIVKKMRTKGQILWSLADLETYTVTQKDAGMSSVYRLVRMLIARGVLRSIRKGLYTFEVDGDISEEDFYWHNVKKTLATLYSGQGIIMGRKALALLLRDYSLPDVLSVLVPEHPRKITLLAGYTLQTLVAQTSDKRKMYPLVKQYATKITLDGIELTLTCPEHALLEYLTVRPGDDIADMSILERWITKNKKQLRPEVFAHFIPHRYISAINRLKYIASDHGWDDIYRMSLDLIDRYGGGCHLSRKFLETGKSGEKNVKKSMR